MRPEMARKLAQAIWRQRVTTYGPTLLLLIVCTSLGGWFFSYRLDRADPAIAMTEVTGIVMEARRVASKTAVTIAHIRLDDGKEIDADSTLPAPLIPNEHVVLNEMRHASGKMSYHVLKVQN